MLIVGYLRVFDYLKEQLICGGKSYYGALLCCTWRYVDTWCTSENILVAFAISLVILITLRFYFSVGMENTS